MGYSHVWALGTSSSGRAEPIVGRLLRRLAGVGRACRSRGVGWAFESLHPAGPSASESARGLKAPAMDGRQDRRGLSPAKEIRRCVSSRGLRSSGLQSPVFRGEAPTDRRAREARESRGRGGTRAALASWSFSAAPARERRRGEMPGSGLGRPSDAGERDRAGGTAPRESQRACRRSISWRAACSVWSISDSPLAGWPVTELTTDCARAPKRSVDVVSEAWRELSAQFTMTTVRELPPSVSWSTRVSLELR
mmetsp:Transcript_77868/g.220739  ORF Transcript_77868/g.220739 Transcript_77868/m.220739 type:complete len:251 (-) Transcript_77868:1107-1859(-)